MKYIFYKKKLVNGKKRRIYKKKNSKKLYLKHKGRMVNVVKYKKFLKRKQDKQIGYTYKSRRKGGSGKFQKLLKERIKKIKGDEARNDFTRAIRERAELLQKFRSHKPETKSK